MTGRGARVRRMLAALAGVLALVAGVGVASAVERTDAAWTDQVLFSAPATAGTWGPPPVTYGCVWRQPDGTPQSGVGCSITSLVVTSQYRIQWDVPNSQMRQMNVSIATTGPVNTHGYVSFTIDLTTATGGGSWTWTSSAATVQAGALTPVAGYACSELPVLRANTQLNQGQPSGYYFEVIENRSYAGGRTINCA